MWPVVGQIAVVVIAAVVLLLGVVWLVFQNDPFEEGWPREIRWGIAADHVIGGAILLLCALAGWIGHLSGMW